MGIYLLLIYFEILKLSFPYLTISLKTLRHIDFRELTSPPTESQEDSKLMLLRGIKDHARCYNGGNPRNALAPLRNVLLIDC
jgi:hypothetical protein